MMRSATSHQRRGRIAGGLWPKSDEPPVRADDVSATVGRVDAPSAERDDGDALREPSARRGAIRRALETEWLAVAGWTLVALLLRLLLVWRVEHVITPDGVQYVALGRKLIAGNLREGLSAYWPPLYPLLVGLASTIFPDAEIAGRTVSAVAGGLLVIPAYKLFRDWYGQRVAFIGAALVSLHPLLIYYSSTLLTESTYTLFFACGVLAGWRALSRDGARASLLAGIAFGACYLLKPEAIGFLLLLIAAALAVGLRRMSRTALKISARNCLVLCAGFMLLALPYLFYLRQETGTWTISGKLAGHLLQGTRPAPETSPVADMATTALRAASDPTRAVVQITRAMRHEYEVFNLLFPTPFVILAGLGLLRRRWTRARAWRELYLITFVAATLVGYAITLPNIRFLVPLMPLLICWLALGLVEFEEWATGTLEAAGATRSFLARVKRLVVPLVAAGLLLSLLPVFVYLMRGDKWSDYYGQKLAAVWIKERAAERGQGASPTIMSSAPNASFYAGGRHVPLVNEDYEAMLARARREAADYIIIDERYAKKTRQRPLLEEQYPHPGLRLAHSLAVEPGYRIVIYELDDSSPQDTEQQQQRRVGTAPQREGG